CRECGRVFSSTGDSVCPDCKNLEEEKFELVKNYLWDNPNSTIDQVAEATEVEKKLIIKFMKEDRLASKGLVIDFKLNCSRCGKEIESGTFCKSCRDKLVSQFKDSSQAEEEDDDYTGGEMFLKDRFKKRR
ncbi:MAG: flagellar protein, partial [Halanaerobiales bacterium]|nr:flagellar protein [Halanaerobiales bacterium]